MQRNLHATAVEMDRLEVLPGFLLQYLSYRLFAAHYVSGKRLQRDSFQFRLVQSIDLAGPLVSFENLFVIRAQNQNRVISALEQAAVLALRLNERLFDLLTVRNVLDGSFVVKCSSVAVGYRPGIFANMDHRPVTPGPTVLQAFDSAVSLEHFLETFARVVGLKAVFLQVASQELVEAAVSKHLDQVRIREQDPPLRSRSVDSYWSVVKQMTIVLRFPEGPAQNCAKRRGYEHTASQQRQRGQRSLSGSAPMEQLATAP